METKIDYANVVQSLNVELYERFDEVEINFGYTTNGHIEIITFGDIMLWNSDNDDREWINDDYEPFEPFIRKRFNQWIDKMNALKL